MKKKKKETLAITSNNLAKTRHKIIAMSHASFAYRKLTKKKRILYIIFLHSIFIYLSGYKSLCLRAEKASFSMSFYKLFVFTRRYTLYTTFIDANTGCKETCRLTKRDEKEREREEEKRRKENDKIGIA